MSKNQPSQKQVENKVIKLLQDVLGKKLDGYSEKRLKRIASMMIIEVLNEMMNSRKKSLNLPALIKKVWPKVKEWEDNW